MPKYFFFVVLLFVNTSIQLYSSNDTLLLDTNKTDAIIVDTIIQSIPIHKLNPYQGSALLTCDTISYPIITQTNYFFLPEIITQQLPVIPLFTTLIGNHSLYSYMGGMPTQNTLLLNNINMYDFYGLSNYDAISPEMIKNIEICFGSSAAIFGGASGLFINLQPQLFNTSKPFTRL